MCISWEAGLSEVGGVECWDEGRRGCVAELKKEEMGLVAGLGCASATGLVDWRVWRGLEGDLVTLDLVRAELDDSGLDVEGRLAGLASVESGPSTGTVCAESSSSSDDRMVFLRRGRPWAIVPADSC